MRVRPLPIDYEIICTFLLHLALNGLKYSTINNELSALVLFAKLNNADCAIREDFNVHLTPKALRRILGDSAESKDELFPTELVKIANQVDLSNPEEFTIWTGVLIST